MYFQHFGEITKNDIDKTTPYLKLTYATRLNAEQAMLRGRHFNEKPLQVCLKCNSHYSIGKQSKLFSFNLNAIAMKLILI